MPDQDTKNLPSGVIAETDTPGVMYTKSTVQMDMEMRLAAEKGDVPEELAGRDFSGGMSQEDLDAFVGGDPIYRNAANVERDKPRWAEEGSAEAEMEKRHTDASDMIVVGVPQEYEDARVEREAEVAEHNEKAARGEVESVVSAPVAGAAATSKERPTTADSSHVAPERAAQTTVTENDDEK